MKNRRLLDRGGRRVPVARYNGTRGGAIGHTMVHALSSIIERRGRRTRRGVRGEDNYDTGTRVIIGPIEAR